jgi:hypothetical protein
VCVTVFMCTFVRSRVCVCVRTCARAHVYICVQATVSVCSSVRTYLARTQVTLFDTYTNDYIHSKGIISLYANTSVRRTHICWIIYISIVDISHEMYATLLQLNFDRY